MNNENESKVIVSVCCLAYNQEKYIEKCLEGFVMQKTDFAYEVLVHDDNSTDQTRNIIMDYAAKYPQIIKPVLEEDNQYSKIGISGLYRKRLYPMVRGKYIAYCEGDDFWISPNKLQKQVDILEKHSECNLCVHYVTATAEDGITPVGGYPQNALQTGVISGYDFMKGLADGYFYHTTSFMCRTETINTMIEHLPDYYLESDVDDVPMLLYLGQLGLVYYLNENLTCYRRNSVGSWTEGQRENTDRIIKHKTKMIEMYKKYDVFTFGKYAELVEHWINNERFMIAEYQHDFREMSKPQYREFMENRSWKFKMKVFVEGKMLCQNSQS